MILQYLGIGFAAGLLAGIGAFAIFLAWQARRIVNDVKADMSKQQEQAKKQAHKNKQENDKRRRFNEMVTHQLEQAGQIIEAQNNIHSQLQQPSKNSLHSRHKNKLVSDWKILEEKKQEIFHNILRSGADPIVNVYDDTIKQTREMKLSQLVQMMGSQAQPIDDNEADKRVKDQAGENATIKKVVKNGKTFHVISNNGNKTEH